MYLTRLVTPLQLSARFAIGSAVLTGLALFAAFLTVSGVDSLNLLNPKVFAGLLAGTVLPMLFTAQTMRAGSAAFHMIEEVRRQFRSSGIMEGKARPDYEQCVSISTKAAFEMIHLDCLCWVRLFFLVSFLS